MDAVASRTAAQGTLLAMRFPSTEELAKTAVDVGAAKAIELQLTSLPTVARAAAALLFEIDDRLEEEASALTGLTQNEFDFAKVIVGSITEGQRTLMRKAAMDAILAPGSSLHWEIGVHNGDGVWRDIPELTEAGIHCQADYDVVARSAAAMWLHCPV